MKELFLLFKEQVSHISLIYKLAIYNIKSNYSNHYLGVFWNFLQPLLQVVLYYIVFGLGLRGNKTDVLGVPFIIHLISGLFPWIFISQSIMGGSSAIQSRLSLVTKMKFPSSTLLSISFMNTVINLLITTSIIFVLSLYNQLVPWWHYFWFLYFIVASYVFIFGISLIMSTLVILVRDTKNILQNVMRMAFFVTPIFWAIENSNPIMHKINAFNPFGFLVGIYRSAFTRGNEWVYGSWHDHLFFWSLSLLLLFIGSRVHFKFRNKLIDYL
ncbi:MAG: ABC transporter permease [Macrococcus canis]|uniref:ABC transporter permease n=1 Tax=Macrococcoides canis TaxID=1855823 RepID=UPI00105C29E0|nr:ABC transporter permease [Macrococcus canis]MEE1108203.1 ABC transporter permease [Macrococcus canis]TDM36683.1 ABC transporter permease [Macrococcus canis]